MMKFICFNSKSQTREYAQHPNGDVARAHISLHFDDYVLQQKGQNHLLSI